MMYLGFVHMMYLGFVHMMYLGRAMYETANVLRADKFKIVCDWYFVIEWIQ